MPRQPDFWEERGMEAPTPEMFEFPVDPEVLAPRQPDQPPPQEGAPVPPPEAQPAPAEEKPKMEGWPWLPAYEPRQPEEEPTNTGPLPQWAQSGPVHQAEEVEGAPGQGSSPAWGQQQLQGASLSPLTPSQAAPSLGSFAGLPQQSAPSNPLSSILGGGFGASPSGGDSRELIDAIEDLTDEVKRLREVMERDRKSGGTASAAPERKPVEVQYPPVRGGGARPSLRGGK